MSTKKFLSRFLLCAATGLIAAGPGFAGAGAQNTLKARVEQGNALQTPTPAPADLTTEGVMFAPVLNLEKGQTRRYATQSSITLRFAGKNGGLSDFSSTITSSVALRYRVRDTQPNGTAQVEALSEGGRTLDASGAVQSIPKDAESAARTLTLDQKSRIIAFKDQAARKGDAGSGLDALFSQSNLLIPLHILPLPEKTAHVGESWTAVYATPGKTAGADSASQTGIKATLTLLGSEKISGVSTMKIKQVLTVPYIAYTDAQGRATEARSAKGRMNLMLTFTQMVNALPQNGLLVRSEGGLEGTIKFEGALVGQVPGDTMTISGRLVALRLDDNPADAAAAQNNLK